LRHRECRQWEAPDGVRRLRIEVVLYGAEASRDFSRERVMMA
jgi:hypothetical protein